MFSSRLTPSRLLVPSLVLVTVLASIQLTQAKRGCAAFGHSCFGGHGKRSDSTINPGETEEATTGLQPPADDVKAFIVSEGVRTPLEIFSRDQPDNELNFIMPPQFQSDDYMRFSPMFRKWLANSFRRGDLVAGN